MNQPQFVITKVKAVAARELALTFADGFTCTVDLSEVLASHPSLKKARLPHVFHKVSLDEWQRGVIFDGNDELALASDNLRALAIEQAGDYSHQQIIAWMHRHDMTLDSAAEALGLSRRMLAYYRSGEKPVPKSIGLAMLGWEAEQAGFDYSKVA
ncbi:DUF2442 domain-containing protein [Xanthomonas sacchari]|uniref:DUF2442 domain-containing protein n=1 Tax=Xanthomonas sacchari TaxID=56458 RepID=A0ABT3E011_9XANT|nr:MULTISPECIES: DUF2442 domain-containing protein [Xanthomonas]AJC45911.1 hypothetical protein SB85_09100 [Xanthomonas sacchari]KAB7773509.1 DUF2442 domain-containing protein [Xanthomonas sp. LMG 12462]KAB7781738.1 DUF2442 domain-containing protein [Xanthomonas sp. LMG 12459]MCW0370048.1 hypothetical protein [Xanthomonas sacchari]MCW0373722.1 hypothetical protein [Xanthomonas sacchari]